MIGIYKLTSPSGKSYIGQSRDIKRRLGRYRISQCNGQPGIYRAIKKYGWDAILVEILCECSADDLNSMEVHYIEKFNTLSPGGYNMNTGGGFDYTFSEETRRRMSEAAKGVKKNPMSVLKTAKSNTGKKRTQEQNEYQSKIRKGIRLSDLAYENGIKLRVGKHLSKETRDKISNSQNGMRRHQGVYDNNTKIVVQYTLDMIEIKEWFGCLKPAIEYGVSERAIASCCRGESKTSCGFKWKYKAKQNEIIPEERL